MREQGGASSVPQTGGSSLRAARRGGGATLSLRRVFGSCKDNVMQSGFPSVSAATGPGRASDSAFADWWEMRPIAAWETTSKTLPVAISKKPAYGVCHMPGVGESPPNPGNALYGQMRRNGAPS